MLGHLGRLGLPLVDPLGAGDRLLRDERARLFAVLPWWVLLVLASAPEAVGGALLVGRVDVSGGGMLLLNALGRRIAPPLVAAIIGGAILHLAARRSPQLPFDRAVDVAAYAMAPYLVLGAAGAMLDGFGLDLRWFPHHLLAGRKLLILARGGVAFGLPAVLVFAWAWRVRSRDASGRDDGAAVEPGGEGSMESR